MSKQAPSQAETEILQALWERGKATVREIHDDIQAHRSVGYTTTLKQMQRLEEKGMVERVSSEAGLIAFGRRFDRSGLAPLYWIDWCALRSTGPPAPWSSMRSAGNGRAKRKSRRSERFSTSSRKSEPCGL